MSGRLSRGFINYAGTPPQKVRWAFWATIAWSAFTVFSAVSMLGAKSYLKRELIKANNDLDAGDKSKKIPYTPEMITHDANRWVLSDMINAVLCALILMLLAVMLLRARGVARWSLIGLATIVPLIIPFRVGILVQLVYGLTLSGAPVAWRVLLTIAGLLAVAVVVLLVLPETSRFFAANKPVRPAGRRSLFGGAPAAATPGGVPADVIDASPATAAKPGASGSAKRRGVATRPGSVKPKAGSERLGRTKSRNQ